ncbi:hypothetical protein L0Y69_00475 [bacterium]|nr:hypothetical protein [bacterium]
MCARDRCAYKLCTQPNEPIKPDRGDTVTDDRSWHRRPGLDCYTQDVKMEIYQVIRHTRGVDIALVQAR